MTKREPPELGEAELEVLKALWDHGPATVRDVLNVLHERGRQVAYTTVQTFLTRLEQKGLASSDKGDLAYVYKPRVSRQQVTKSRLKSVIEQLFDGAPGPLVLQLMQTETFQPDEVEQLRQLIDQLDAENEREQKPNAGTTNTSGKPAARRRSSGKKPNR